MDIENKCEECQSTDDLKLDGKDTDGKEYYICFECGCNRGNPYDVPERE